MQNPSPGLGVSTANSPNGSRPKSPKMTRFTPNRKLGRAQSSSPMDGPSVRLLREMELLGIHETELNKVAAYQQRAFYEDLNRRSAEQAERDFVALAAAQARREAVRQEAEAVLQAHIRDEEEKARRRREEQARREAEEVAKKAAEEQACREAEEKARRAREETEARERAEKEEAARKAAARQAEAARKAAEEKAAKDAADAAGAAAAAAAATKAAVDEAARVEAAKEAEAAAKIKAQSQLQPQPQSSTSSRPSTASPGNEALHSRYLAIHARLKAFRADFWNTVKKGDPKFKSEVGDMRRLLRTSVGQLVEGKGTNKQPTENVRKTFSKALNLPSPPVDVRDFLAKPPTPSSSSSSSEGTSNTFQFPSLMIYMVTIFAKAVIAQFTGEAAVNTKSAEPAGVLAVQILAMDEFSFQGASLIDILLAKFHASCPVLWGISGSESTAGGKKRLGWRIENGAFVSEQRHSERMTGLGAGFAAISLRNFSKTKLKNPFPPREYWQSLANIVNVPPEEVQLTHLTVLRSMVENAVERFILFFDGVAVAALRHALVEFPSALPAALRASPACKALEMLVEQFRTEKNLSLI